MFSPLAKPCVPSLYLFHVCDVDGGTKRKQPAMDNTKSHQDLGQHTQDVRWLLSLGVFRCIVLFETLWQIVRLVESICIANTDTYNVRMHAKRSVAVLLCYMYTDIRTDSDCKLVSDRMEELESTAYMWSQTRTSALEWSGGGSHLNMTNDNEQEVIIAQCHRDHGIGTTTLA
jgi:hypothetical protein